jgi:hypothetical protein
MNNSNLDIIIPAYAVDTETDQGKSKKRFPDGKYNNDSVTFS